MKTKGFTSMIILLTLAHFSTSKHNIDLSSISLSDDYFNKYMQQNVKSDLEKINLLDRLVSTPPHSNSDIVPKFLSSKSSPKKSKRRNSISKSRHLSDVESTYESLFSPDYTGGIASPTMSMGGDTTSCELISEY